MTTDNNTPAENSFIKSYDKDKYPAFALTADLLIFTIRNGELCVLMVKRGGFPYQGYWALPGGFVGVDESSEDAAIRELKEETGIDADAFHLEQLKTYSTPDRDPRMRVVSTAYNALVPDVGDPIAGDDAAEAHFFAVNDLLFPAEGEEIPLAFDHIQILTDGLQRVRDKIEYSTLAPTFLPTLFTLADLRRVYETIWDIPKLHAANFRRKVLNVKDFIVPVGTKGVSKFDDGRTADLYRLGDANMIFPPIMRPVDGEDTGEDGNE